jgi:hypothetical protein
LPKYVLDLGEDTMEEEVGREYQHTKDQHYTFVFVHRYDQQMGGDLKKA